MAARNPNRVTRKMINDAYPGEGYFFFGGGDAVHWLSSSVMVKKISDLTFQEWLAKFDELLEREGWPEGYPIAKGATDSRCSSCHVQHGLQTQNLLLSTKIPATQIASATG